MHSVCVTAYIGHESQIEKQSTSNVYNKYSYGGKGERSYAYVRRYIECNTYNVWTYERGGGVS